MYAASIKALESLISLFGRNLGRSTFRLCETRLGLSGMVASMTVSDDSSLPLLRHLASAFPSQFLAAQPDVSAIAQFRVSGLTEIVWRLFTQSDGIQHLLEASGSVRP